MELIQKMYLRETWAEGFVVLATAWYLGIDIWVTSGDNTLGHPWSRISATIGMSPSANEHNSIRVVNIRRTHFQSLCHNNEVPRAFVKPQPPPRVRPTKTRIQVV